MGIKEKVTAIGVTPDYLQIHNRKLKQGKNLSQFHLANRSPVCVIGPEIAQRLFSRMDPLGQVVSVSDGRSLSYPCRVIGVLREISSPSDWSPPNRHILLPYTYFQSVGSAGWLSEIHEVAIQIREGKDVEKAGKGIQAYYQQKFGKSGHFMVDSDSTLIAQMKRFLNLFSILLAAVAALSLLVGGIGISNMMLVSVSERVKEFGIRKALGATHRSIRVQILMESSLLCGIAGTLGLGAGFVAYEGLIYGATRVVPNLTFEWVFEPAAALISFFAIGAVGMMSGLVPALKAERLQVIDALRTE